MYDNIGKKIKILTIICTIVATVAFVIFGIVLVAEKTYSGFVFIFAAPVVVWTGSFFMYGFGELIDKVSAIERNTHSSKSKSDIQIEADTARLNKIESLRSRGLITEEEYKKAISKGE